MNSKKMNEKGNVILIAILLILICVCIIFAVMSFRNSNNEPVNGGGIISSGEISGESGSKTEIVKKDTEVLKAYKKALEEIYNNHTLPDGTELFYESDDSGDSVFGALSDNMFAIADINSDGKEELIVSWTSAPVAGLICSVIGYDTTTKTYNQKYLGSPSTEFYDNGVITNPASHNQGLAGDKLWPYSLYKYNKETDSYDLVASVDAWDKELAAKDYDGTPYPTDVDKSGDGVVYYIMPDGTYSSRKPINQQDYNAWINQYIGTAKKIELSYKNLTEENINNAI